MQGRDIVRPLCPTRRTHGGRNCVWNNLLRLGTYFEDRYRPIEPTTPSKELDSANTAPVEMVTVPALGPEWGKSELRDMTKAGRREKKKESRKEKWKQWNRGETGMCGSYCTRKVFVWFMFGLVVVYVSLPSISRLCRLNEDCLPGNMQDCACSGVLYSTSAKLCFQQ